MNPVGIIDIADTLLVMTAFVIILIRAGEQVPGSLRILVTFLAGWMVFRSVSNALQWTGVTDVLDQDEDLFQILEPIFWGGFFLAGAFTLQQHRIREAEQRRIVSLTTLVGGVAHELSTPIGNALTAITHSQMQLKNPVDPDSASLSETLDIAETGIRQAADILRSFRNITVDPIASDTRMVVLPDLYRQVWDTLAFDFEDLSIRLDTSDCERFPVSTPEGALVMILEQVFRNMIEHGLRPAGGGVVRVRSPKPDNSGYRLVRIENDGVLIAAADLARVTDPFFTTGRKGKSHPGLGLTMVHNLLLKYWNDTSLSVGNLNDGNGVFYEIRMREKVNDPI